MTIFSQTLYHKLSASYYITLTLFLFST